MELCKNCKTYVELSYTLNDGRWIVCKPCLNKILDDKAKPVECTAKTVQLLLLRQNYEDRAVQWNLDCERICQAFKKFTCDPRNQMPNLASWVFSERPIWPHVLGSHYCPDWTEFPNPLWGWLAFADYGCFTPTFATQSSIEALFQLLICGGCNHVSALHSLDSSNHTLLQRASSSQIARQLLIKLPRIRILPPVPCIKGSCSPFMEGVTVARHLTVAERKSVVIDHHSWFYHITCGIQESLSDFVLLIDSFDDDSCDASQNGHIDHKTVTNEEVKKLKNNHLHYSNDTESILEFLAARQRIPEFREKWAALKQSFLMKILLSFTNEDLNANHRIHDNPLHAAIMTSTITPTDLQRDDECAAWLAARLSAAHLNQYADDGRTVLMIAVLKQFHLTVEVLLSRKEEVDHRRRRLVLDFNQYEPLKVALLDPNAEQGKTALEHLPDVSKLSDEMKLLVSRLKEQSIWQRDTYPDLLSSQLKSVLASIMPVEILTMILSCIVSKRFPTTTTSISLTDQTKIQRQ